MVSFSVYRKNSVNRISFFRWMSETFDCVDFTHLEKSGARSSATPVRLSACGHMAFDLPVPCHWKSQMTTVMTSLHATDHKFQAPQILADHLCDALVFSCNRGTSASFHFNDFSTSRIVGKLQQRVWIPVQAHKGGNIS